MQLRLEAAELMTPAGEVQEEEEMAVPKLVNRSCCGRSSCKLLTPPARDAAWMVSTSFPPAAVEGTVWRMTRGGEESLESPLARTVVRGTDSREPEDVSTMGTDTGVLMDLMTQNNDLISLDPPLIVGVNTQ